MKMKTAKENYKAQINFLSREILLKEGEVSTLRSRLKHAISEAEESSYIPAEEIDPLARRIAARE